MSLGSSEEFARYMAQFVGRPVPLAPGLEAAAEDCHDPRLAAAFREIAAELEQGRSMESVLSEKRSGVPSAVHGLLVAAARTGRLGETLAELVDQQRADSAVRRRIVGALAYPLIVACLAAIILSAVLFVIVRPYEAMFSDFGLELPAMTLAMLWLSHNGPLLIAGIFLVMVIALILIRWLGGRSALSTLLATAPIIGPLWLWTGVTQWLGLLAVLLRNRIPMPESLRLSADGVRNTVVAGQVRAMADRAEGGETLSQMVSASRQMPASLVPLLRWGESKGILGEALAVGREMFETRIQQRCWLLQTVLPAALFIAVGCGVLFVVGAIFLPLISMLNALS
ncbi:MAG: type II secretion system F family protein [Planctomycetes bacterium]|nr:type II secretion system F family protein [Planctomycetota bacterium]